MSKRRASEESSGPPLAKRRAKDDDALASEKFPELAATMPALKKITYKQFKEIAKQYSDYESGVEKYFRVDMTMVFQYSQAWQSYCAPFTEMGFKEEDFRRITEKVGLAHSLETTPHVVGPAERTAPLPESFTVPYMGPGLDIFQDWLKTISSDQAYCREIVMVQSSGSGKSRLVTDATRINLGILLNVGGYKSQYPREDIGIANALQRKTNCPDRPAGIALLVTAVIEYLTESLKMQFAKRASSYISACNRIAKSQDVTDVKSRRLIIDCIVKRSTDLYERLTKLQSEQTPHVIRESLPPSQQPEQSQQPSKRASRQNLLPSSQQLQHGASRHVKVTVTSHSSSPDAAVTQLSQSSSQDALEVDKMGLLTTTSLDQKQNEDNYLKDCIFDSLCSLGRFYADFCAGLYRALRLLHELIQKNAAKCDSDIYILIGFDELQQLCHTHDKILELRWQMTRVFALVESYRVSLVNNKNTKPWFLHFPLLGTHSAVAILEDDKMAKPSDRSTSLERQPLFISFPFDVNASEKKKKIEKLSDCLTMEFVKKLGRPLWSSSNGFAFAFSKLFCVPDTQFKEKHGIKWWSDARKLAMLSRRLALPFHLGICVPAGEDTHDDFEQSAKATENTQIERHLRQLLYISKNRKHRWSAATSEPLLSLVAFEGWLHFSFMQNSVKLSIPSIIFDDLRGYQRHTGRNAGDRGEIALQVLVIGGIDDAKLSKCLNVKQANLLKKLRGTNPNANENFPYREWNESIQQIITVKDFLLHWLNSEALNQAMIDAEQTAFLTEMESFHMYVTHFVPTLSKKMVREPSNFRDMALRGAACMTPPNYEATDAIIPIFKYGNLSDVTLLQFQVKNQSNEKPLAPEFASMAAQSVSKTLPLVNIFVDFARESNASVIELSRQEQKVTRSGKAKVTPPAWQLFVCGVTEKTFGVLKSGEDSLLEFLNDRDGDLENIKQAKTMMQAPLYYDPAETPLNIATLKTIT